MAITLFGSASNPADNGTGITAPVVITPPGSMQVGDLVFVTVCFSGTSGTLTVSQAGGQTWTSLTTQNQTRNRTRSFYCTFNGTWSASPSWTGSGTANVIARMLVFRPNGGTTSTWAVDVAEVSAVYAAPTTPFTVTIPEITTVTNGALVVAGWTSADDNTWGSLGGSTHSWTALTPAQVRNTSTTYQQSQTHAWMLDAAAGATGTVYQNQATLGGDAGTRIIIAFKEIQNTVLEVQESSHGHTSGGTGGTITVKPGASGDDAERRSDSVLDLTATYAGFGELSGTYYSYGSRFINVPIVKDSIIVEAHVTFRSSHSDSGTIVRVNIQGESNATPAIFTTYADYMARTRTTATVPWSPPAWTSGSDYNSADITSIIQEIVNLAGWASGNNLVLFFADNASDTGAWRQGQSYNLSSTLCPILSITYGGTILTQVHNLTVQESNHTHFSDNIVLETIIYLVVQDATDAHSADSIALIQQHLLSMADSLHAHSSDAINLTQAHNLTVFEANHSHATDGIGLIQNYLLSVTDSSNAHTSDSIVLNQTHVLSISEPFHAHVPDEINLFQNHLLGVDESSHYQTTDYIMLETYCILKVQDGYHGAPPALGFTISGKLIKRLSDKLYLEL